MGCNCKVNKQLIELQNRYAVLRKTNTENTKDKINDFLKNSLSLLFLLPVYPFIFLWLIIKTITGRRKVDISFLFRKSKKNVRHQ